MGDSFRDLLISEGASPAQLPKTINNECNGAERLELYAEGGCFFVTSRILIVDLLSGKLEPEKISGMLVYDAHRISESCIESFILRIYREKNQRGFIKAFSEQPESVQGSVKTERLLKTLHVAKLFLWPRFRQEIHNVFETHAKPEIHELSISLSRNMKAIQSAILVAMQSCLNELHKACPQLEAKQFELENGLFQSFDFAIRAQLDPEWHRLSHRTKQLVNDVSTLRKLCEYLVSYDAFSFYYLLLKIQSVSREQQLPSLWLTSEAANRIFTHAKERVFRVVPLSPQCAWLRDQSLHSGVKQAVEALQLDHVMEPVLEVPPKWTAFTQTIDEIRQHSQNVPPLTPHTHNTHHTHHTHNNRVLIVVRDELTLSQLRDVLSHDTRCVAEQRFRWFVSQQCAAVRKRHAHNAHTQRVARNTQTSQHTQQTHDSLTQRESRKRERDTVWESVYEDVCESVCDSALGELLTQHSTHTEDAQAETESDARDTRESPQNGFLQLGLCEQDVRALPRESQLMLLQERILRDSPPLVSQQSTNTHKRARTEATVSVDEGGHTLTARLLDTELHLTMLTHTQLCERSLCGLRDLRPAYIVLYDADVKVIRHIESFQSTQSEPIVLYFLQYEGSTEEHRYAGALSREKRAFSQLIHTKEHLVVSLPFYETPSLSHTENTALRDSRHTLLSHMSPARHKIVCDIREFRCILPAVLYSTPPFLLLPHTLTVGDYVLSTEICVERKSVPDLCQSFTTGRLYTQCEAMCRYYQWPSLLVEFTPDKPFALVPSNEIGANIQSNAISSKLVLLTQRFPSLRILWTRSPHQTAEVFKSLITHHSEVDVHKAVSVGTHNASLSRDDAEDAEMLIEPSQQTQGAALSHSEHDARLLAQEILLSLPGISQSNLHSVINSVESVAALSEMSEKDLAPLVGPVNAQKLRAFFRQRVM